MSIENENVLRGTLNDRALLKNLLLKHEALRLFVYDDADGALVCPGYTLKGHPTIGIGRCLDRNGVTKAEAYALLERDIDDAEAFLKTFPWYSNLTVDRQNVVISMVFQLGRNGFKTFKKMIAALEKSDWELAAQEMLDSNWARRFTVRSNELVTLMRDKTA